MGDKASWMGHDSAQGEGLDQGFDTTGLCEVSGAIKWFDGAKGYLLLLPDVAST